MNKILLTGSSGYVGKNFYNYNKNKYLFEKFSLLNQKIENINFDGIDIVLHSAALVHQKIEHSYEKYYEINVVYPVQLAKKAKQNNVKQFIFISTIAVYGEDKEQLNENTICEPTTHYGKSKLEAEKQLLALNDDIFIVSIIRLPMIYGEGAPGNVNNLIQLIKTAPILPLAGIQNKKTFISIQNLCYFLDEIIQQQKNGIFLVSDDVSISTSQFIELLAKNLNKKIFLIKIPFFDSLLKFVKPSFYKKLYGNLEVDNTNTKKALNLKNLYNVEMGMRVIKNGEKL